MKLVYDVGIIKMFENENLPIIILNNTIENPLLDIIGIRQDKFGVIRRIKKDSLPGKEILKTLTQPAQPEPLTRDPEKLGDIIDRITNKLTIIEP
jgi:hypothetical protein